VAGGLSVTRCYPSSPSGFHCLSQLLSAAESPWFLGYQLINRFPNAATNDVKREARAKQGLNSDDVEQRASTSGDARVRVGEERAINGVDKDLRASGGPLVWVRFWFGLDSDDKRRVDCREQTSLRIFDLTLCAERASDNS